MKQEYIDVLKKYLYASDVDREDRAILIMFSSSMLGFCRFCQSIDKNGRPIEIAELTLRGDKVVRPELYNRHQTC